MEKIKKLEYEIKILKIKNSINFQFSLLLLVLISSKLEPISKIIYNNITQNSYIFIGLCIIYALFILNILLPNILNIIYFNWKLNNKFLFNKIKYSSISKYVWTEEFSSVFWMMKKFIKKNWKKVINN